jgi:vesicle coat complex subunit
MYDIKQLILNLGDPDPKVKLHAVHTLWDAASNGADITAAIPALVKALSDGNAAFRGNVAWTLEKAVIHEKNHDAAMPALTKALSDENPDVRNEAARVLWNAATIGADIGAALPALAEALYDEDVRVRQKAVHALEKDIGKCDSLEQFNRMETSLREGYGALRAKRPGKNELAAIRLTFFKLMAAVAKKRDSLAPSRDIMLTDIPKPPNKGRGGMFQTTRRALANV